MRKDVEDTTPIDPNPTLSSTDPAAYRFFPVIMILLGSSALAASPDVCIALRALATWVI